MKGIDRSHLISPFQCDICIFRSLFKQDPSHVIADVQNMAVIRCMNLDMIWSQEPSTIAKNMSYLKSVITIGEASGFEPQLPALGPGAFEDRFG